MGPRSTVAVTLAAACLAGCRVTLAHQEPVKPCSITDPTQQWGLRAGATWGQPNDVVNAGAKLCLDVAKWDKSDNASVGAHQCCCTDLKICGECGHPDQNYNQAYGLDRTTTPPRLVTGEAMGGRCIVLAYGQLLAQSCSEASAGSWLVYDENATPPIRVAGNRSLCLAVVMAEPSPPGPRPPPGPSPPWTPVPQACAAGSNTTGLPFCNVSLGTDARVADLVNRMTIDEKVTQLVGGIGGGVTQAIPRLGIPPYQYHSEGLHGIRDSCQMARGGDKLFSTLFPQVTAMAATGNMTLIKAMAAHMGDEARAVNNYMKGNTVGKGGGLDYWGPTMNVCRDPRWGRIQESVSEDPWLNGAYAANFVEGIQGSGDGVDTIKIASTCKHFYGYSLESSDGFSRHTFNAVISPRDLTETYLPPFAMCIAAKPEEIMCSYNEVNGIPTCLDDKAQNGYLREKLGWEGLIVSDCDAIGDAYKTHKYSASAADAAAEGIKGGCDQDCGNTYNAENLLSALSSGKLTESELDVALGRAMRMRMRVGMFDPPASVPYTSIGIDVMNSAAGQELAVSAAEQSVVLLDNDAGVLPIGPSVSKIAVVGPLANDSRIMMGGKSDYCPEHTVTVCDGLMARSAQVGSSVKVTCDGSEGEHPDPSVLAGADLAVVVVGGDFGTEGHDRVNISLPDDQQVYIREVVAAVGADKTVLVVINGDPIALDNFKGKIPTIVNALEGGQEGGTGLASVLFGDVSPSGMLPFTVYPDAFVTKVPMSDMSMRPNGTTGSPGRTYRFYIDEPLWPFGFGLHYTTFSAKFTNLPSPQQTVEALQSGLTFVVDLTNTGKMPSGKVVQLYVRQLSARDAPLRSLAAINKVQVGAGETVKVELNTAAYANTCPFCVVSLDGTATIQKGTQWAISVGNGATDMFPAFNLTVG
mmetsp:Transcript_4933/g.14906  ORF Transcript_4933/g.14906 Transcript_4933/m.14906 type:complete len:922 (+) Transcript_4933:43-2808(+)